MAPFDFNYVQDDLLVVTPDRSTTAVRVNFSVTDCVVPAPAPALPAELASAGFVQTQTTFYPEPHDDSMLRAVAARRAATIRYDTKIVTYSYTEILLEFLDRNATLTSVGFIICYVGVLRYF
jgi:hypothetical protein